MTYKQIETSREARLWIGQVIIPAVGVVGMIFANPEIRAKVVDKAKCAKQAIKKKLHLEKTYM